MWWLSIFFIPSMFISWSGTVRKTFSSSIYPITYIYYYVLTNSYFMLVDYNPSHHFVCDLQIVPDLAIGSLIDLASMKF